MSDPRPAWPAHAQTIADIGEKLGELTHLVRVLTQQEAIAHVHSRDLMQAAVSGSEIGGVTETPAERDQKLRWIARRLREIQTRCEAVTEQWGSNLPLDASNEIAALDEEKAELRAERQRLQDPYATPETVKGQLDRMWKVVLQMEDRLGDLEDRINDWFAREAADRRIGWRWANGYRLALLVLVAVDIVGRALK